MQTVYDYEVIYNNCRYISKPAIANHPCKGCDLQDDGCIYDLCPDNVIYKKYNKRVDNVVHCMIQCSYEEKSTGQT